MYGMPQESRRMVMDCRSSGRDSVPSVVGRRRPSAMRRIHWSQFNALALAFGKTRRRADGTRRQTSRLHLGQVEIAVPGTLANDREPFAVRVPARVVAAFGVVGDAALVGSVGIHDVDLVIAVAV